MNNDEKLAALEEQVCQLQEAVNFWRQNGFPEKTILILLNHYTKVPQRTIRLVLEGIDALYDEYFAEEDDE